jgi:hypothetical protein
MFFVSFIFNEFRYYFNVRHNTSKQILNTRVLLFYEILIFQVLKVSNMVSTLFGIGVHLQLLGCNRTES